jgi:uncharacterized protein YidB (DUF937 family)
MFDGVISEVASRFGLGADKAKMLVGWLLSYITGSGVGGLTGFITKLRNAGLGSILGSQSDSLLGDQVKSLFGSQLGGIASRLGLGEPAVTSAIGMALPAILHKLAPGGHAPATLPADVNALIQSAGGSAYDAGRRAVGAATDASQSAWGLLTKLLPLLGLVLLGLFLYRGCNLEWGLLTKLLPLLGLVLLGLFLYRGCNLDSATPTVPRTPSVPSTSALPDLTKVTDDVRGLFTAATDKLSGIKDAATADAALPDLKALLPRIDGVKSLMGQLPGSGKSAVTALITDQIPKLKDLIAKVLSIAGISEKLKPTLDAIVEKLAGLTV